MYIIMKIRLWAKIYYAGVQYYGKITSGWFDYGYTR